MSEYNSISIKVESVDYQIRTEESEAYMESLAALCDEKLREADNQAFKLGLRRRYVLAMLNIADEYLKLKQEYDAVKHELDNIGSGEWK